jgi:hypothetical protein
MTLTPDYPASNPREQVKFGMKRSEAHLVEQVLRGRKDYYAPLVERYLPAVRSVARANAGPCAGCDSPRATQPVQGSSRH